MAKAARVHVTIIEDPENIGYRVKVLRRNDVLINLSRRRFITDAEFQAGKIWQDYFNKSLRGLRGIDPTRDIVDGGQIPQPDLTNEQIEAGRQLENCKKALGDLDNLIIYEILAEGLSLGECAKRHGAERPREHWHFGNRFKKSLNRLAVLWGISTDKKQK